MAGSGGALPVIDVGPLAGGGPAAARGAVAEQIQAACRERGFFYVTGHGVPAELLDQLADASAEFFALPLADKLEIAMERGGRSSAAQRRHVHNRQRRVAAAAPPLNSPGFLDHRRLFIRSRHFSERYDRFVTTEPMKRRK